ncbi:PD40 domain-containing protein [bacterium]|nr:PD40 domain-containing protein [bacterium]
MRKRFILTMLGLLAFASTAWATNARPLMRQPDIHGDMIVFSHGADLWKVNANGGVAIRLTVNDGTETNPQISSDGKLIAFNASYDGNNDIYIMNTDGGNIRRVTFHPGGDNLVGWHPTENKIIFNSGRDHFRYNRLWTIRPDGTDARPLIMHEAAQGSFNANATQIAYNKVAREGRTWKRYRGGLAQEIYLYDFKANEDINLTNNEATDRNPMWVGDVIVFASDRDRVLNLFSVNPVSGETKKLTNHTEYDARFANEGSGKVIYEHGGELWVLDVAAGSTKKIDIRINADAPETRPAWADVSDEVKGFDISPGGKRALITARGEIFSVPVKHGPTRNLSDDCGAHDKDAVWSPDGRTVAFFSDRNGEYNLFTIDAKGQIPAVKLTGFKKGYRHTLRWSPDSKILAYTDETLTLFTINVATKKITKIDKADYEHVDVSLDLKPIYDFTWSPNSKYIAYSKMNDQWVTQVWIHDMAAGKNHRVSADIFNDFHPAFSADGRHLFFVSNRRFSPTYCDFEWQLVYKKTTGIFAVTLHKNGESIQPLRSDEEGGKKAEEVIWDEMPIDFKGISDRIEMLPLDRGNYRYLQAGKDVLFYMNRDEGDFNRFEFRVPADMDLKAYNFGKRKEETVIDGIGRYKISADGSAIAYTKNNGVGIIAASARKNPGKALNLRDLKILIDPVKEWAQLYNEAWRMERDFFYDPNMHGLDWKAIGDKYRRLLPFASNRQDVGYLIGEMIGELNTSHTYVFGGDRRRRGSRVGVGLLGADYDVDTKANRYRIAKIYDVADWTRGTTGPLTGPGKDVRVGDYILKVNGVDVTADRNFYSYFDNLARKQVTLVVNDTPTMAGARIVTVMTAGNERTLRYRDWVEHNRKVIDKASNGDVGYLHMPDTFNGSAAEFPKYFYSLSNKKGIVIDGRFNGGGLDPVIFLQRLMGRPHAYWTRRHSHDQMSPFYGVRAHMALITNRQAGSGGDELPDEFQYFKMGPVIGTRTWGGLVGVSMFMSLMDGGGLTAPDYRIYHPEGKWIVENEGVTPDIIIDNHPAEMAKGKDAQLLKALEEVMKKIKSDPIKWPKHPPIPSGI